MAPSGRRRRTRRSTRKPRRTQYKKQLNRSKNQEMSMDLAAAKSSITSSDNSSKISFVDVDNNGVDVTSSGCSTPKGPRYQIPQISTCPPAPMKPRVLSNCSSLRRTSIAFFAPPDLELFFFFALRNILV